MISKLSSDLKLARANVVGWWWLFPLAWFGGPSRIPPKDGVSIIRNHELTVRLHTGELIVCSIDELYTIIEVYGNRIYDVGTINQVQRIADVGANIGVATLWLAQQFPSAQIVSVEPGHRSYRRLIHNIERNKVSQRVTCYEAAVGASTGLGKLQQGRSSTLSTVASIADSDRSDSSSIAVWSLSQLLSISGGTIDLMKIDCEGSEYPFINSATDNDLRNIRIITGEYHDAGSDRHLEFEHRLVNSGFSVTTNTSDHPYGTFLAIRP
ncbi:MAG: FkbM family methyltransferase [Acidimicrobiales bacterium]